VPSVSGGVLWPDSVNKLFYLFGGEYSNSSVQSFSGLWFYDTLNNKWDRAFSDGSQTQISWPAFGASAITDEGMAYYYGGYLSNKSVSGWTGPPLMLNSLVTYDMNQRRWSNRTNGIPRAEGTLQYIPAGDRGMLIYFGGMETSTGGFLSYVRSAVSNSVSSPC
jgi:N-acetylneuraminic acid mutarotase|tara:strand:- start:7304 stop:7795 length:492 start_codon:yes stop_codon:yes gene_type:complete